MQKMGIFNLIDVNKGYDRFASFKSLKKELKSMYLFGI